MCDGVFWPPPLAGIVAVWLGAGPVVDRPGYRIAGIPVAASPSRKSARLCWIWGLIFLFHAIMGDALTGALIVARFILLIALAALVTLTTRVSDMIATIEAGLQPFTTVRRSGAYRHVPCSDDPFRAGSGQRGARSSGSAGGTRRQTNRAERLHPPRSATDPAGPASVGNSCGSASMARGFGRNESFPEKRTNATGPREARPRAAR